MTTGRAVVAVEPGRVAWQEVDIPEPGPDDVVVRVTHSWISNGTEGSFIRGERIAGDTPRRETDPLPFPHVPGYQKVGIVERVGAKVTDLLPGEMVFATVSRVEGMFYSHGGHVSPAVTHRSQIWKIPPGLDPVAVSGLVLTQVGYNVGIRPALQPGDAAVVIGDGMVGQWAAQTLQDRGARTLLLGRHDDRLARFALRDGDRVANILSADALTVVKKFAPDGAQVLCDTVGSISTLESLYPALRRGAHLSSAGFYGPNGLLDIQKMRDRELTLHAPAGWTKDRMDATLALLAAGRLSTLPLITHRFPASACAEAYGAILARQEGVLGVILDWEDV